jgi:2'-5' RNA ligase
MSKPAIDRVEMARLFVALWPQTTVRDALAGWRDAWTWPHGVSPVARAQLHLTLHFIGGVPRSRMPELLPALSVALTPFELRLGQAALWSGGTAVLTPARVPHALLALQATLADRLRILALPVETRRFRPHVTLARRAMRAAPPEHMPDVVWSVRDYALVESSFSQGYRLLRIYR